MNNEESTTFNINWLQIEINSQLVMDNQLAMVHPLVTYNWLDINNKLEIKNHFEIKNRLFYFSSIIATSTTFGLFLFGWFTHKMVRLIILFRTQITVRANVKKVKLLPVMKHSILWTYQKASLMKFLMIHLIRNIMTI